MKPKLRTHAATCRMTQRNSPMLHTRLGSPVVRTWQSWDKACKADEGECPLATHPVVVSHNLGPTAAAMWAVRRGCDAVRAYGSGTRSSSARKWRS